MEEAFSPFFPDNQKKLPKGIDSPYKFAKIGDSLAGGVTQAVNGSGL